MANNTKYITLENLKKYDELLKTYIAAHASSGSSSAFRVEKVDTLPNASDAEAGVLYVVPNGTNEEGQRFDEYMLVDGAMEKVGSSSINLSDYYTKEEVADVIAAYAPFEIVTELPSADTAITSKIYILTEESNGKQKGSYVLANSEWVSVGTTVTPATNPEVAEGTQNNGGNDPDPNDPNQGGNGGNEGGNTDPDPEPVSYSFTIPAGDEGQGLIDSGTIDVSPFLTAASISESDFESLSSDGSIKLYYTGKTSGNSDEVQTALAAIGGKVEIPYDDNETRGINANTLRAQTHDTVTFVEDYSQVGWYVYEGKIGMAGILSNGAPTFMLVDER